MSKYAKCVATMAQVPPSNGKLYAISDLHVDIKENREFVESWSDVNYQEDGLIVAGDVTDFMSLLKSTLETLKSKFKEVYFVPGMYNELSVLGK